jgi:hypothetical protein
MGIPGGEEKVGAAVAVDLSAIAVQTRAAARELAQLSETRRSQRLLLPSKPMPRRSPLRMRLI